MYYMYLEPNHRNGNTVSSLSFVSFDIAEVCLSDRVVVVVFFQRMALIRKTTKK